MAQKSRFNKNSFVIQGSILAIAGILVRVIGLIYRIPLTRILGDEGNGYYSTAFDIYNLLLLLSSQSMPLAVSKIVSEKLQTLRIYCSHQGYYVDWLPVPESSTKRYKLVNSQLNVSFLFIKIMTYLEIYS